MIINLVYEANAQPGSSAPQSFRDGMQTAANLLQAAFVDSITVNISVSYGTFGDLALPNQNTSEGDIGYRGTNTEGVGTTVTYANLRNALLSHEISGDDIASVASLPNTTSLQSHSSFTLGTAQSKALGLVNATGSAIDGQVGMGTNFTGNVLISGALHELTHAMGRIAGLAMDVFRYTGVGTHLFGGAIPASAAYLSFDGGNIDRADFGRNSDPGDFLNPPNSNLTANDPFNETVGNLAALTSVDLREMDVLGFTRTPAAFIVNANLTSTGLVVSSTKVAEVKSGGTTSNTAVLSGGIETVFSGGIARGTVLSGGEQDAFGATSGTIVSSGGLEEVYGGAAPNLAVATQILNGGRLAIEAGGVASGASIGSGGREDVFSGGTASSTTVGSGGVLALRSGGTASGGGVQAGGSVTVSSGGRAVGVNISGGGTLTVSSGGSASNSIVGGSENVSSGGTSFNASVSGGNENVSSGGRASGSQILNGSTETVLSGGTAVSATVAGGLLKVSPGGVASNTIALGGGGSAVVSGTTVGTLISGGAVELAVGAVVSGAVDFRSVTSGQLRIDGTTMPSNVISGLTVGDSFDLPNVPFDVNGGASLQAGNVLRITENGTPYLLNLDPNQSFANKFFQPAPDAGNGTLVRETGALPPTPSGLALAPGSDTGAVGDNITSVRTPVITGNGQASDTVRVFDGSTAVGTGTVGGNGVWSVTLSSPLGLGSHTVAATQTDGTGGISNLSTALSLTIVPPTASDVNADAKSDVLWRNSDGTAAIWEMNGAQILSGQNAGVIGTDWRISATPDINGDGRADVLWRNTNTGTVSAWELNGFQILSGQSIGTVGTDWSIAGAPDVNGDGTGDVLWRNPTSGAVAVWEMNGFQIKAGQNIGTVGPDWRVFGTGDVDGDGNGDVIWRNTTTGTVAVWEMNGFQVKTAQNVGSVGLDWAVAGIGDFDSDGKADVLWRNTNTGDVSIWELNGFQIKAALGVGNVGTGWNISGTQDVNGDGKSDILWRDSSNGAVSVWLMNGFQIAQAQSIATIGTSWSIVGALGANGTPAGGEIADNTISAGDAGLAETVAGAITAPMPPTAETGSATVTGANSGPAAGQAAGARPAAQGSAELPQTAAPGSIADNGSAPSDTGGNGSYAVLGGNNANVTVWGGAADPAVSANTGGGATVTGFAASGGQGISFPNETPAAVNQVITSARTANGNTLVTLPDGSTLTLAGVTHIDSTMFR